MEPDINRQALTCQRVIITGGNSGIGLVTAKQLAAKGATVLVAGRASDKTEAALQSINAEAVTPARNLAVDLSSLASVEALIENVQREGEPIDGTGPPVEDPDAAHEQQVVEAHLSILSRMSSLVSQNLWYQVPDLSPGLYCVGVPKKLALESIPLVRYPHLPHHLLLSSLLSSFFSF